MYEGVTLTGVEAAAWFSVAPSTIRQWASDGKIRVVGHKGRANLYSYAELVEADRATRNSSWLRIPRSARHYQ